MFNIPFQVNKSIGTMVFFKVFKSRGDEGNYSPSFVAASQLFGCGGSEDKIEKASKCPLTFPIMQTRIMQNIQHTRRATHQTVEAVDNFCANDSQQHISGYFFAIFLEINSNASVLVGIAPIHNTEKKQKGVKLIPH